MAEWHLFRNILPNILLYKCWAVDRGERRGGQIKLPSPSKKKRKP